MVTQKINFYFEKMPALGVYVQYEFEQAKGIGQYWDLMIKWRKTSFNHDGETKKYFQRIADEMLILIHQKTIAITKPMLN